MSHAHARLARAPRVATALVGLALAGSLAACSGSTASVQTAATGGASSPATSATTPAPDAPSAKDLLAKAKAATAAAKSGRVRGTATDKGETYVIDSASTADGKDATGTFTLKSKSATIKYVVSGGSAYLSGNEGFWKVAGAPADQAATLGKSGKWVKTPAAQATELTDSASFASLIKELFAQTGSVNSLTQKVEAKTVAGVPCWVISDRFSGSDATFSFDQESNLPVQISATQDGAPQKLDFDEWDAVPAAKAPAASQIIAG